MGDPYQTDPSTLPPPSRVPTDPAELAAREQRLAEREALVRRTSIRSRLAEAACAAAIALLVYVAHALERAIDDYQHRAPRPCVEAKP